MQTAAVPLFTSPFVSRALRCVVDLLCELSRSRTAAAERSRCPLDKQLDDGKYRAPLYILIGPDARSSAQDICIGVYTIFPPGFL